MYGAVCGAKQEIWKVERKIVMKVKIITGIISTIFAVGVLFFMHTVAFPIIISFFTVVAVYEIEKASGLKNIPILIVTLAFSAIIPFFFHYRTVYIKHVYITFAIAYIVTILVLMLLFYKRTRFEHAVIAIFSSVVIPFAISTVILLRDIYIKYPSYTKTEGVFFILFALFSAWLTDTFAFFIGKRFGKHKLCPEISPKKTVEGAFGGIIGQLVINFALLIVFERFFFEGESHIKYPIVMLLSLFLSGISMCGDLIASLVKRNYGIKDFGFLFPGNGGVMDRFDSAILVFPVLYAFVICLA